MHYLTKLFPGSVKNGTRGYKLSRSWERVSRAREYHGLSGFVVFLVLLSLLVLIFAIAFVIIYWRKNGCPTITIRCYYFPALPTWSRISEGVGNFVSRLRTPPFAFARFSNNHISQLNLDSSQMGDVDAASVTAINESGVKMAAMAKSVSVPPAPIDVKIPSDPMPPGIFNQLYGVIGQGPGGGGGIRDDEESRPSSLWQGETEHHYEIPTNYSDYSTLPTTPRAENTLK